MKPVLYVFFFFFLASSVLASATPLEPRASTDLQVLSPQIVSFEVDKNASFFVQLFNSSGSPVVSADCQLAVFYSNGSEIQNSPMTFSSGFYRVALSDVVTDSVGSYSYSAWCNETLSTGGFYESFFYVTPTGYPWASTEDLSPLAALIFIPFLLALVMLVGAVSLNPLEHAAFKLGLFVMSFLTFFVSAWWGSEVIGRFYYFPSFSEALADTTFYFILFFILIIFYVVVYFIQKAFHVMAQNKKERLNY